VVAMATGKAKIWGINMIRAFAVEKLQVKIFSNRREMGKTAGHSVAKKIREILGMKKALSIVFASAPSQNEFLEELSQSPSILWNKVTAFHLDEYIGLSTNAPESFGHFLKVKFFEKVDPGNVYYLNGRAGDLEAECKRYADLLRDHPLDVACIGIGENGHLAFNDPPFADFQDPLPVKVVELDLISRQQQVRDGCFKSLQEVPQKAITLTIPVILSAAFIYCMVPGQTKAEAVRRTLQDSVSTDCPATILRKHGNAILFLDRDSAKLVRSVQKGK
jgi:glucosamine-6-phosphate deaminase